MKKLVALFLVLMAASFSLACASADTDMQPYLLGEFLIEVPADWTYWHETDGSMIYFAPSAQDEQTKVTVAMHPHSTKAVTAEDDLYSLVNMLYGEMDSSTGTPVEFSDENGFLMGIFEILTSSGDEVVAHGMVCNSESAIMLILYFNILVSDDTEKAEFDDICKTVSLVGEDYFDYSIDTLYNKSLNDLVELQRMITMAMWNTEDWQEVIVPIGVYEFGVDIPAKHWSISVPDGEYTIVSWVTKLDESGKDYDYDDELYGTGIMSKTYKHYDKHNGDYPAVIDIDAKDGTYLIVEMGNVVFTPFTGKPALGFK